MKKHMWAPMLAWILSLTFALLALPVQVMAATTLDDPATNLSAVIDGTSHTLGAAYSGSASLGSASMRVGALRSAMNGTLTLTNKGTEKALLSFSYSLSGTYTSCTIAGAAVSGSGTYNTELDANESVAIYLAVAGYKNATVSLTNIKLEVPQASAKLTVAYNSAGAVSVGGTVVSSGATVEVTSDGTTLTATPNSGAKFVGWVNTADNSVYSIDASLNYLPTGDASLKAIFASPSTAAVFWCSNKTYLFEDLNAAISHASSASSKVVTLAANGTLPTGTYTIPSGVTLLIPFDSAGTCYTTTPGYDESSYSKPSVFYTLTMESGANIVVNGAVSVSAKVSAKMGYAGAPTSSYGHIAMNEGSSVTVQSGGNLYAWGFITGSGTVSIKNGGSVYESFQVVDWRGGTASSGMIGNDQAVFPMTQYYVQNVEAPMTYESGANEYCSMVADVISVRQVTVKFLGTSACMFNLSSGTITKRYDGNADKLVLDIDGTASISQTTIDLILTYKIQTQQYVLPLNNMAVNVNDNSTLSIDQTVSVLPGSQIIIAEKGKVVVNSGAEIFVIDEDEWKSGYYVYADAYFRPVRYAPGMKYTRTAEKDIIDAKLLVNGVLDASQGALITTTSGGNICSTGEGVIITSGTVDTLYQATQSGTSISYVQIGVVAAKLKNGNGSYVQSGSNTYTYCSECLTWVEGAVHTTGAGYIASNLELGNNLNFHFAFYNEHISATSGHYIMIGNQRFDFAQWTADDTAGDNTVDYYIVTYTGLAAKQMKDTITVTLYDGSDKALGSWTDSIYDYALRLLAKYDGSVEGIAENKELCTLLVDMLNYGAACQNLFGYNTGNLANDGITGTGSTYTFDGVGTDAPDNSYFIGSNLITTGNIQFAVLPEDGVDVTSATYEFTNHWGTVVTGELKQAVDDNKTTYYYVDGLVVADAAEEGFTIAIKINGEVVYEDSVEGYCARMYNKEGATDAEKAAFLAFMKFSTSANTYLEGDNRVE